MLDDQAKAQKLDGYTTHQLMERWGVNRSRVSWLAKRLGWRVVGTVGRSRTHVYEKAGPDAYDKERKAKGL